MRTTAASLTLACLLLPPFLAGGAASAQVINPDPLQPNPIALPIPNLPRLPAPVSVPLGPEVSIPTPIVAPQAVPNPIGNPIGNPLGNPIGNPLGNPIQTPIGNPIGNPLQTPDVTAIGRQAPGGNPGGSAPNGANPAGGNQDGGNQGQPTFRVLVGTYTNSKSQSEGVYRFTFDAGAGTLSDMAVAAQTSNPSFLAIHPSRKFVYVVNEVGQYGGKPSGSVSSYAIDPQTGNLTPLNTESSGGADPCYVTVDGTGAFVLVANYTGGSVGVFPVGPDGKLGPPTASVQHRGSGPNKGRQAGPHAHSVDLGPNNRYVMVADLGLDKLLVYHLDATDGSLRPNIPPAATLAPGAGPRHLAFHPDGRHAYVINEMASTITLFDFDPARGSFAALETIHTRPDPRKPGNATAEIVVHPSGRFVYGSNRGDDTIAIFAVAPASGKLTHAGFQPTGGKTPRNFAIDPTGQFLLAGNQDSNTIAIFRIDQATGHLSPVGEPVPCPAPVCIRFLPMGG